tara:strand:+ start:9156 stop:10337 length:1182 start_codon:yes stop_codon:yes gene_type:complete
MAFTQLALYNDALLLLGQRALQSLTEDRAPRYLLDGAYNSEAIRYCLEISQPPFASKTLTLSTPSAGTTFSSVHTLPEEYVSVVGVFSDARLDQEVSRYVIEGRTLESDYETVYLRCTSDAYSLSDWDASFGRVVAAYLALETATKISTEDYDRLQAKFDSRVNAVRQLAAAKVPQGRPSAATVTLTNAWRHVYNDALLIMGLDEITSNTDDSNRRAKMDRALDVGLVADMLEDTGWQFGQISTRIQYDPSAEPAWGYQRAIPKPTDLHRIDGLYTDEYMRTPLKRYVDETHYWFTDNDEIFLTYISTDYLVNPDNWPTFFKRLIAARIAKDTAPSLRQEGADVQNAMVIYEEREASAKSNDAMNSPPRILAQGSWTRARYRGGYRGRPGDAG